ncbi:MAG: hypothetical protein H7Y22_08730 [Gemmatimonadaceae bacterium]|nr:hypothetical protein [Gloeobacterales cyanobacterium ES-bin-141]
MILLFTMEKDPVEVPGMQRVVTKRMVLAVLLRVSASGKLALVVNLPDILKRRMNKLGIDAAELVRRYARLRIARGEVGIKANNVRRSIIRVLDGEGSPTAETLVDLVAALGGKVTLTWQDEVMRIEVQEHQETLANDLGVQDIGSEEEGG